MAVQRQVGRPVQAAHDRQADRQVRDEVAVHDVDVQPVGVRHRLGLVAEPGEVGGEDARRDHRLGDPPPSRSSAAGGVLTAQLYSPRVDRGLGGATRRTSRRCRAGAATAARSGRRRGRAGRRTAAARRSDRMPGHDFAGLGQVRRAGHVGDQAAGTHQPQRRGEQLALQRARARRRRPECAASGPRAGGAAPRDRSRARRAAPGRSRRRRCERAGVARRSTVDRPVRASPARPGRRGAGAPRWRSGGAARRRRARPAAPPCRPGRRTGRASARRGRSTARSPERERAQLAALVLDRRGPGADRGRVRRDRRRARSHRVRATTGRAAPPTSRDQLVAIESPG